MRRLAIILVFFTTSAASQQRSPEKLRPDSFSLAGEDLFVITQYQVTDYMHFAERDNVELPANLSTVHYYVDINGNTDSMNLADVNYLYLKAFNTPGVT